MKGGGVELGDRRELHSATVGDAGHADQLTDTDPSRVGERWPWSLDLAAADRLERDHHVQGDGAGAGRRASHPGARPLVASDCVMMSAAWIVANPPGHHSNWHHPSPFP